MRGLWRGTLGRLIGWLLVDERHGTDDLMAVADAVGVVPRRVPHARRA